MEANYINRIYKNNSFFILKIMKILGEGGNLYSPIRKWMVKLNSKYFKKGWSVMEMPYSAEILRTQRIMWYIQFIWDRDQALGEVWVDFELIIWNYIFFLHRKRYISVENKAKDMIFFSFCSIQKYIQNKNIIIF